MYKSDRMKASLLDQKYIETADLELRSAALEGDKKALEMLIGKHYSFIYNLAMKMTLDPSDAEDVTQDVIIKIITHLKSFEGKSAFRTWLYRIVVNHILNMKKRHCEVLINDFKEYGNSLEAMEDGPFPTEYSSNPEKQMILEETKLSCTAGMLMCLDREQRLILAIGAIFEINHEIASEVLGLSKDNYRQKLSRAKSQLLSFMNDQCGLVNKSNSCRCHKKARAFMKEGIVDPKKMVFNADYKMKIRDLLDEKNANMEEEFERQSLFLFKDSPFYDKPHLKNKLLKVLDSDSFKRALE